jgi:hypothetical protein
MADGKPRRRCSLVFGTVVAWDCGNSHQQSEAAYTNQQCAKDELQRRKEQQQQRGMDPKS